jgi:hypothetical protein
MTLRLGGERLKQYKDPVTGDPLSPLEFYTRQVQVCVRTPWFIFAFNLVTLLAMLLGHLDSWNFFASWLAIIIEWLVGTYMFGQTGRDAAHIRRIDRIEKLILERLGGPDGLHNEPLLHAGPGEERPEHSGDEHQPGCVD